MHTRMANQLASFSMAAFVVVIFTVTVAVGVYAEFDIVNNEYSMPDLIGVSDSAKPAANRTYRGYRLRRGVDTAAVAEVDEPVAGDDAAPPSPSKKHHASYVKCCNDESDSDNLYEGYRDLRRVCLREYRATHLTRSARANDAYELEQRLNQTRSENTCVSQCVARRINIIDADGNLIEASVRSNTLALAQADWQRIFAGTVADTCLAENTAAAMNGGNAQVGGCNPSALHLSYCTWREFTLLCPRELQSRTTRCVRLRDRLANGENLELQFQAARQLQLDQPQQPQSDQQSKQPQQSLTDQFLTADQWPDVTDVPALLMSLIN